VESYSRSRLRDPSRQIDFTTVGAALCREGFFIRTSSNAGEATIQGWELSYQQQFTFLPGLLRGLSLVANFTALDSHGNFGINDIRKSGEIPDFRPRTGNLSLSWSWKNSARAFSQITLARTSTASTA